MHFESKTFKIQAWTASCGSSTRSKTQQHKLESSVSSQCAGVQTVILHLARSEGPWILHQGKITVHLHCWLLWVLTQTWISPGLLHKVQVSVWRQNVTKIKLTWGFLSQKCWHLFSAIWNPWSQIYKSKNKNHKNHFATKIQLYLISTFILFLKKICCVILGIS